jgi:thioredoxin-related protein
MKNLNKHIKNNLDKRIVLFFGSEHCGACKAFKEKLKISHGELKNTIFLYLDNANNNNSSLFETYQVMYLPSLFIVRVENNKVKIINQVEGYDWDELRQKLN